jgi:hypothetical protein
MSLRPVSFDDANGHRWTVPLINLLGVRVTQTRAEHEGYVAMVGSRDVPITKATYDNLHRILEMSR